jgi:hypothetical protein
MYLGDSKVCCIKGCDKDVEALGLCVNHYRLNRKYGSPVAYKNHNGLFRRMSVEQRFLFNVEKTNGCWNWTASVDSDGYGRFSGTLRGQLYKKAHRFSYAFYHGDIGDKLVCHTCDNPRCVNPAHLFLGSNAENMADRFSKGRFRIPTGEHSHLAKISEEQAKAILIDPRPYAKIAQDYAIAASTVGSIKNRNSWTTLDIEPIKSVRVSPRKGVSDKLTPDDVRFIRESNISGVELARKYGISPGTITDIRKRRSWAHVT